MTANENEHNTKKNRKKAWQFFKLMFISGAIFLLCCILLLIVAGWYYQDNIRELFAKNLSQRFDAELEIGDIKLNLLRGFPLATITLSDVTARSPNEKNKDKNWFEAENIHLRFNLIDILRKDYNIIQLSINNGSFKPHIDKNGKPNFKFKADENDGEKQSMQFNIKRLLVRNMQLAYTNDQNHHHLLADIRKLQLRNQLKDLHSHFETSGDLYVHELSFQETSFAGIDIGLDLSLEAGQTGNWIIHLANIAYNDYHFEVSGIIDATGDDVLLTQTTVSSQNLPIASVIPQLPPSAKQQLLPFEPNGLLSFEAKLDGLIGNGHMPHISSSFAIKNASCKLAEYGISLTSIDLQAHYTNGDARSPESSQLSVNSFNAHTAGYNSLLKGNFSIKNFVNNSLAFRIIAETNADELLEITKVQNFEHADGKIKLDISFAGNKNINEGFCSSKLLKSKLAGKIEFSDLDFKINDNKHLQYQRLTGNMHFNNNKITAEHISGFAGNSNFVFSGTADNFLPYLFLPNEQLFVEADLQSSLIMLDELLHHSETSDEEKTYILKLPKRLQLILEAHIDQLKFKRFCAESIYGTARLSDQKIHAERLIFNTMEGLVNMTGVIDASMPANVLMYANARLEKVNINQLFFQTGNFGQSTIIDENIHGSVTANMFFSAEWSEHLDINWESMETIAQLRVENGRLLNFEPMMALGRFIRAGELDDVSFSAIENQINIKNKKIIIPLMEVSSNVLNMQLQGEHTFENEIDYRIRVLLSDLLSRQHRERRNPQEDYGEIIDDGLGRTTLFLRLTGTTLDPVLRYDQEGVREKLRTDFREERQNLRNILREEFRFLSRENKDSLDTKINAREAERQLIKKQEENGFIIEWE